MPRRRDLNGARRRRLCDAKARGLLIDPDELRLEPLADGALERAVERVVDQGAVDKLEVDDALEGVGERPDVLGKRGGVLVEHAHVFWPEKLLVDARHVGAHDNAHVMVEAVERVLGGAVGVVAAQDEQRSRVDALAAERVKGLLEKVGVDAHDTRADIGGGAGAELGEKSWVARALKGANNLKHFVHLGENG